MAYGAPDSLKLGFKIQGDAFGDVLRLYLDALAASGQNAGLEHWEVPPGKKRPFTQASLGSDGDLSRALRQDDERAARLGVWSGGGVFHGASGSFDIGREYEQPGVWSGSHSDFLHELKGTTDARADAAQAILPAKVESAAALCRWLLKEHPGRLRHGSLERAGGAAFLPSLPLVGSHTHLVVCSTAEIEQAFDDPDAVWEQGGWEVHERWGEMHLLLRGVGAGGDAGFVRAVRDGHFAMARAAKPNLSRYFAVKGLSSQAEAAFKAGDPRLIFVGYDPETELAEYSCYVDPGYHVQPWEIAALDDLVAEGRFADGREVQTVRVVFFARDMAEREKRPLLDIGAQVFYLGESAELVPVT